MARVIVDRFEGEMAVVETENGKLQKIPGIFIPDAHEGDCVDLITGKVSRFYFASIDNDMMTILTPKGKYAMSPELGADARPGEPILFNISNSQTKKRKTKIKTLMGELFE